MKKTLKQNLVDLIFSLKQVYYFKLKVKKIKLAKINKKLKNKKYVFIFIITNEFVKENKKIIKMVNDNKKIIKIERYYFNNWCNNHLDKKSKYVILNNFQHVKYEYRLIRNKNIRSYLIKD